ncbi:transmembrane protein 165 isoform X1 [Phlebotomus argentipes]|uniref:transmembrane protein 165 isoform X1 n=1 Tax=Phlebotomus argentipes TaxID=94469 RepID=UPI00289370E1|nr:transmembrane protein 165 isoform X1 [Phlebotomus argentipes]
MPCRGSVPRWHFYVVFTALSLAAGLVLGDIEPHDEVTESANVNFPSPDGTAPDGSSSTLPAELGFWHAFLASISVILVSELGDKTFFIAAIMAMRHPRLTVFAGAISALALMTVLSAVFGMAATIIPRVYTYYISTALFAIFGLKMLKDGYYMSASDAQEELEEVQSDLRKREDELIRSMNTEQRQSPAVSLHSIHSGPDDLELRPMDGQTTLSGSRQSVNSAGAPSIHSQENGVELRQLNNHSEGAPQAKSAATSPRFEKETSTMLISQDPESGAVRKTKARSIAYVVSRIFMQAFTMTFLAEWGDRSQLTTIILGAREDVYGVVVGGILGHCICTGLAVIGGRMIAQRISVRTVTLIGGVVFLLFAFSALFFNPNSEEN